MFDFVLNTFIRVIAGERSFTHGIEKIRVKGRGVIDGVGISDEACLLRAVIIKIWTDPEGQNIFAVSQTWFQGNYFFIITNFKVKRP